jgi:hypothetical protein
VCWRRLVVGCGIVGDDFLGFLRTPVVVIRRVPGGTCRLHSYRGRRRRRRICAHVGDVIPAISNLAPVCVVGSVLLLGLLGQCVCRSAFEGSVARLPAL